ncbi:DNA polymerase beta-like [Pollicipes pollicipes]|uniref:DNA polymerase beta-like n=1 Tax=Pollicipes pollicipes TaxID=41117 RepID=UPI0018858565|nr:DNA polymerase beta-like [Pollicipes pollicipes]
MSKRKLQPSASNPNQDYCDFLLELADFEKNVSRNIYKHNAYRKAASALSRHPVRVSSGSEARQLPGVGRKIADKIDEFVQTGRLGKLDKIRASDEAVAIGQLSRVSGVGPAKARELFSAGVTSLEELRRRPELLNHHQSLGLRYVSEFEARIPRTEAAALEGHVCSRLAALDPLYCATVCGSYRRGAESSGDVDFLLTHPAFTSSVNEKPARGSSANQKPAKGSAANQKPAHGAAANEKTGGQLLRAAVDQLKNEGFITDTLSHGDTKFMGVCLLPGERYTVHRRIDIRLVPHDQYFCAVLYFTGSDEFNRQMRAHALEQRFTLNEYTLRPLGATGTPGEPVPVTSEEEIFEYLQYPYRRPEERSL